MSRILLVLLLLLAPAAALGGAESRNPSPEGLQLEGIYLGQSFADVDRLLDLRNYNPLRSDRGARYTWVPPRDIHDLDTRLDPVAGLPLHLHGQIDAELYPGRRLLKIDLVFRKKRVSEVRASYASAALFTRMGSDLEQRYGVPSSIVAPPPRFVLVGDGAKYSLFLQIWTWQWDDATLTVTGEHYRVPGNDMRRTGKHRDIFRFHLKAADDSSSRP